MLKERVAAAERQGKRRGESGRGDLKNEGIAMGLRDMVIGSFSTWPA
jgi:hypothetical protein